MAKVKQSPPKPKFRVGQAVVLTRAGFLSQLQAHIGTPLIVVQVYRGGKRDRFTHRYLVRGPVCNFAVCEVDISDQAPEK